METQRTGRRPWLHRLSIAHLWCLTVLAGIFIVLSTHPIRPHDFWWHIAVGREISLTHQIPTVDTFSSTARGAAYPSYQMFWLMEVVLYQLYRLGGPALVIFGHTLSVTAAYAVILKTCEQRTQNWRLAAFGALFAAALGLNDWNVRPQAATFGIGALFFWAIERCRRAPHPALLAIFPLGMALWVNSHGSFPIGLLLIGLWLADESWIMLRARAWTARRLIYPGAALGLAALACLINPQGLGIITYVTTLTGNPAVQRLATEWAPPTFDTLTGTLFLGGLLLEAALLALSPRRPTLFDLGLFLILALLGLKTVRGSLWFGLLTAPIVTAALAGRPETQSDSSQPGLPWLNAAFAGMLLAAVLLTLPWFKDRLPLPPAKAGLLSAETPIAATQALLREQPPAPLFHNMAFGSYLIWAAQPDYPVFVDGRIELYPLKVWQDYLALSAATCDWEARLAEYGIRTLMLSPQEQPTLVQAARTSPHWKLLYEDAQAVIFTRQP